ncbi:CBS domain-containing protein [Aureimonas altamirensis DSM 21988]|uniref:CBS-domain-containing membrane protein n=2 Tax=Aureimonas altamirensis TaxID=370622 RepID=A0A0P0YYD3_9HYPH|nr:CBS domain-containing protein [Aureimonas altamirensis]BAT26284.1 CBS-domain-containing membrane protein [Aureimonas altamirensis]SHJ43134.1 CBS domain-containing protein [Aureimonas altamirensis DSM 21988]
MPMKASELMVSPITTIKPDMPVADVAAILLDNGFNSLPVVDDAGNLIGIVTTTDLIVRRSIDTLLPANWWSWDRKNPREMLEHYIRSHANVAGDMMSSKVRTLPLDADMADIVAEMVARKIRSIVILDKLRPVGIVTRSDILKAIHKAGRRAPEPISDEEIRRRLMEDLRRQPWFYLRDENVRVEDGIVYYSGNLSSQRERLALRLAAESMAEVRGIEDATRVDVSWS